MENDGFSHNISELQAAGVQLAFDLSPPPMSSDPEYEATEWWWRLIGVQHSSA